MEKPRYFIEFPVEHDGYKTEEVSADLYYRIYGMIYKAYACKIYHKQMNTKSEYHLEEINGSIHLIRKVGY